MPCDGDNVAPQKDYLPVMSILTAREWDYPTRWYRQLIHAGLFVRPPEPAQVERCDPWPWMSAVNAESVTNTGHGLLSQGMQFSVAIGA